MSQKQVTVNVEEKSYDIGQAVVQIVQSVKQALADGFQPGQDLPTIITGSMANLITIVADAPSVPAESQEDLAAFIKSWALAGLDISGLFLKK